MTPAQWLKSKTIFFIPLFGALLAASTLPAANRTTGTPTLSPAPSLQADFSKTALPILKQSCFTCHAPDTTSKDPVSDPNLLKKIGKEISDSTNDFQMGPQFPFPNKTPEQKQLILMDRELRHHTMPPDLQKQLNLGQPLSDQDRQVLLDWVNRSRKTLN